MNNSFSLLFKKYVIAGIILILGIFLLIFGSMNNQDSNYMTAAFCVIVGGIVLVLISSGKLNKMITGVISAICLFGAFFLIYSTITSISNTETHMENYAKSKLVTQNSLKELKEIQKAFYNVNGRYAGSFDELKDFFENGKTLQPIPQGSVPIRKLKREEYKRLYTDNKAIDNNMTEWEATLLSRMENPPADLVNFKRDTIGVSFKASFTKNKINRKAREAAGMNPIEVDGVDSLFYIPMTGGKEMWSIEADSMKVVFGDTIPVVRIEGKMPFAEIENGKREEIGFGSLEQGGLSASWE